MKLTTQLKVNGKVVPISSYDIRLTYTGSGRAVFTVKQKIESKAIVEFSCGYNPEKLTPYFIGYIHNVSSVNTKQDRIVCNELLSVINKLLPVSLRNTTLEKVLEEISRQTKLDFVVPPEIAGLTTPYFYSTGKGPLSLSAIGSVFGIEQFIFQQQGNGQVYVGPWSLSYWAKNSIPDLEAWKTEHGFLNNAKIPAIPNLRPGVKIGNHIVTQLDFSGVHMTLNWHENPWA